MATPPVGNEPKVRRIKATYYQAHQPTQPPDRASQDLAVTIIGALVLIAVFIIAILTSGPVR